jgi:hypothetical protein
MIGYCILGGVLFLFSLGITSIVCDNIFNKEEDFVFIKKKPPQENFARFIAEDYTDANYDDNIKAIENSIQALKKAAKPFKGKIFWNAAGYGQSMIGADVNGENVKSLQK